MTERSVGRAMKRWRGQRNLSLKSAGELLGFSGAKLSLMENALQPTELSEVIALALAYRVKSDEWKPIARRLTGVSAVDAAEDINELHQEVSRVREFCGDGLALLIRGDEHAARLESSTDPLSAEVVISEQAVRKASDQRSECSYLLEIVRLAERGQLNVQVLRQPEHEPVLDTESFAFLSFHHKQHNDAVFVNRPHFKSYIEDAVASRLVLQGFHALQRAAIRSDESTELIADLAEARSW